MRAMLLSTLASRKAVSTAAGLIASLVAYFGFDADPLDIALGLSFLSTLIVGQAIADAGAAKTYDPPTTFREALGRMLANLFLSKKHLATLAGFAVAGASHYGLEADPELVLSILGFVGAYVMGQGLVDGGRGVASLQRDHTLTLKAMHGVLERPEPEPAPAPDMPEMPPTVPPETIEQHGVVIARRKPRLKL